MTHEFTEMKYAVITEMKCAMNLNEAHEWGSETSNNWYKNCWTQMAESLFGSGLRVPRSLGWTWFKVPRFLDRSGLRVPRFLGESELWLLLKRNMHLVPGSMVDQDLRVPKFMDGSGPRVPRFLNELELWVPRQMRT